MSNRNSVLMLSPKLLCLLLRLISQSSLLFLVAALGSAIIFYARVNIEQVLWLSEQAKTNP